jgi:hypothetical protein
MNCPHCLACNVIAPANGPTCTCNDKTGPKWWPKGYADMPEGERVKWHEGNAKQFLP